MNLKLMSMKTYIIVMIEFFNVIISDFYKLTLRFVKPMRHDISSNIYKI